MIFQGIENHGVQIQIHSDHETDPQSPEPLLHPTSTHACSDLERSSSASALSDLPSANATEAPSASRAAKTAAERTLVDRAFISLLLFRNKST